MKKEARTEPRLARGRRGTVTGGAGPVACLIQDFSTGGFLVMSTGKFAVGDVLTLKSELYPGRVFECRIEVRHVTDDCYGTRIVEISEPAARLCRQFIEEHYADRLRFEGR